MVQIPLSGKIAGGEIGDKGRKKRKNKTENKPNENEAQKENEISFHL